MAKFGKTNYFTKITLVYLCLCQIFSQIEEPKFWTILAKNGQKKAKMAKFGKINYFTKIALVYSCLCQIFSQIEENERI